MIFYDKEDLPVHADPCLTLPESGPMAECMETIRCIIPIHRKRYPLMNEEDIVKLVFQGMLGVGHLVTREGATERLQAEMSGLERDGNEPLTEELSPEWFRLNLRAARARGLEEPVIARLLFRSAGHDLLGFTRQHVFLFCIDLDCSEAMKNAAVKVLDGNWLPSHSAVYREAYRPAYRVLHTDCKEELLRLCSPFPTR